MQGNFSRAHTACIFSCIVVLATPAVFRIANAADLYECKGANGVVAFQNEPCPAAQKTVAHGSYQREPDAPQIVDPYAQPRSVGRTSSGAVISQPQAVYTSPVQQQSLAYQCTAGNRQWVQYSPCPATYVHGVAVDGIEGTTTSGQHVTGSGWAQVESPVQQQSLDRSQLCARLGDGGARISHSGQSDVYERNVARRKYCGQ